MGPDLPQRTNLGSQLGQAIGGGLERGLNVSLNTQYERGLLANAINQAKQNFKNPELSPIDQAFSLTQAFAGIPGSDRILSSILPLVLQKSVANNVAGAFKNPGVSPNPSGLPNQDQIPNSQPQVPNQSVNPNTIPQQNIRNNAQATQPTQSGGSPIPLAGGLPLGTMTPQQTQQQALDIYQRSNGLVDLPTAMNVANAQNEAARKQLEDKVTSAQAVNQLGEISKERNQQADSIITELFPDLANSPELTDARSLWFQVPQAGDINKQAKDFREKWKDYQDGLTALRGNLYIPGAVSGLFRGGEKREETLKKLEPLVQRIAYKYGQPERALEELLKAGATRTEAGKLIYPYNQTANQEISKLPENPFRLKSDIISESSLLPNIFTGTARALGPTPEQKQSKEWSKGIDSLKDFIKKAAPGQSLAALRDASIKKKYHWDQFYEAEQQAEKEGFTPSPYQSREIDNALNRPDASSMENIFRGEDIRKIFSGAR